MIARGFDKKIFLLLPNAHSAKSAADSLTKLEYEVSFRVTKKTLPEIISRCMTRNGTRKCAKMLDAIKAQGYKYSTLSAISVAVCDAVIPPQKQELIAEADKEIAKVGKLFNRGLISDNERYNKTIAIWQATTDKVSKAAHGIAVR